MKRILATFKTFLIQLDTVLSRHMLLITWLGFFAGLVIFYNWDLMFCDSVCYLKNVLDFERLNYYRLADRLIHFLFMHGVTKLCGPSVVTFFILRNIFRLVMLFALFIWWLVFKEFTDNKDQKHWLAFFMISTPVFLYTANQILPEHFSILFSGLTVLFFLKGINKNLLIWQLLSGVMMYLCYFSRNDGPWLIVSVFLSLFIFAYKPKKRLLLHMAITGFLFLILTISHKLFLKIPMKEVSPMFFNFIIKYSGLMSVMATIKYQLIKAVGFSSVFALFSINSFKNKNVKIIFLATIFAYLPILILILKGYAISERHTIQGALLFTFLVTIGFLSFINFWKNRRIPILIIIFILFASIYANIVFCANHMAGGFNVKKAYKAMDIIEKKYPSDKILLAGDYLSYFFYYFVYPDKKWIYISYGGWKPDQRQEMKEWGKTQHGNRYMSTYQEIQTKNPKHIIYLGFKYWSAFNDDKRIIFNDIDKNLQLSELKFN